MDKKEKAELADLLELMRRLRAPDGCPWDREQTPMTLTPYIIEEAHEVIEAIACKDPQEVCGELGDLLFQIIFQARIFEEQGQFDFQDVIGHIYNKMIVRHPHVFGEAVANTSEEVRQNWVKIKKETEGQGPRSALGEVPESLPALLRGRRLTENAGQVGFDWSSTAEVMEKVEEEWGELRKAVADNDAGAIDHELGDMLFALVNLSRFVSLNPELSLAKAVRRFVERFLYIENAILSSGRTMEETDMEEMERLWQEAKKKLAPE